MTDRKKKGIGLGIGGALSIIAGVVLFVTTNTPEWVPTVISLVGLVAGALGFKIVEPDVEE